MSGVDGVEVVDGLPGGGPARELWAAVEPVHAAVYFHPGARAAYEEVGIEGFWMGYFASRSAALGTPGPGVVAATFYGFDLAMVERSVPGCWALASPEAVLEVRLRLAGEALAGPAAASGVDVGPLAEELVAAVRSLPPQGRPLFAAHAALPVPDDPLLAVWWACTALREHRGDGHVAALVAHGIGPCDAHVLKVAAGDTAEEAVQPHRGFDAAAWAAARQGLAARGLLEGDQLTGSGALLLAVVEHVTDQAAEAGWWALGGGAASDEAVGRLRALADAVVAAGAVPFPNAMGLPDPRR